MAARGKFLSVWLLFFLHYTVVPCAGATQRESKVFKDADEKDEKSHKIDSVELIMFMGLLVLTILTIWLLKHLRLRWIHETGLATIYGIVIGIIVRYSSQEPIDLKWYNATYEDAADAPRNDILLSLTGENSTESFTCHKRTQVSNALESRSTFDPEIFFYVILPPIIFHAGYSMKRRHFFRNFGAIIAYAFLGTIISAFTIGGILYGFAQIIPFPEGVVFYFTDCLWFGSIISATDPVTVLAIFHDLQVDVDLYALVFGESVLNDAVAIVLASSVRSFSLPGKDFDAVGVFESIGLFIGIFLGSFSVGAVVGCINALITKNTKLRDFPVLESSLFVIVSYMSYLIAEALEMSGIVSVLFCGIFQAHYTFNNLSEDSKKRTKEFMELLNFLTENFVFVYIGITVFTHEFKPTDWNPAFIFSTLLAMTLGRLINVYPLSFLLNLGRKNKIPFNFQHMMMFSGLRGAIAFALAIRHAASTEGSATIANILLTTTIVIVILTVIGCGALTLYMLQWLRIRVGVDDQTEQTNIAVASSQRVGYGGGGSTIPAITPPLQNQECVPQAQSQAAQPNMTAVERARMVRWWNRFDNAIMKPVLTNYRMTLSDNFPGNRCCGLLSRLFTTPEQFQACAAQTLDDEDSDVDLIIDDNDLTLNHPDTENGGTMDVYAIEAEMGDLGVGEYERSGPPPLLELNI